MAPGRSTLLWFIHQPNDLRSGHGSFADCPVGRAQCPLMDLYLGESWALLCVSQKSDHLHLVTELRLIAGFPPFSPACNWSGSWPVLQSPDSKWACQPPLSPGLSSTSLVRKSPFRNKVVLLLPQSNSTGDEIESIGFELRSQCIEKSMWNGVPFNINIFKYANTVLSAESIILPPIHLVGKIDLTNLTQDRKSYTLSRQSDVLLWNTFTKRSDIFIFCSKLPRTS